MLILLLLLLLVIPVPSPGYPMVGDEKIMDRLKATYREIQDITADFTQRSSIQGFEEKVFEGRLYIRKPRMVRWDYLKPAKQNIFIKGERVILYLPEQRQAIVQAISDHPDAEPALGLLTNIEKWEDLFHIKRDDAAVDILRIELRPKKMPLVKKVLVEIDKETFYIKRLTLFEESGNRVSFNFSNIRPNSGLKEGLFEFKIPKGVEVLEY